MSSADEPEDSWDYASRVPLDGDPVQDPELRRGQRFGPYEVLGALGAGGMGLVFRVRDPELGREFALKVLKVSSPQRRERFLREGRLTAALRHPGIVRIHTAGEVAGQPFLLYELVEGSTPLSERLAEASLNQRLEWVLGVAYAVGHAHAEGVVHRDLKAENVLIDAHDRPRVIDFGLAFAEEGERLTRTGATPGTPRCMAPEQISGEPGPQRAAPPVDVWALGVLLYRALTGVYPFPGTTLLELAGQVCGEAPEPPRVKHPEVPAAVEAVCLRALSKDPSQRFADGAAFGAALEAAIDPHATLQPTTRLAALAVCGALTAVAALVAVVGSRGDAPADTVAAASSDVVAPPSADPHRELRTRAEAAWVRGDFNAAAVAYAELSAALPADPDPRAALAGSRYRIGELEPAVADLQVAVELALAADVDPTPRLEAWAERGWVRYGEVSPTQAPWVFDPRPYDFGRPWPGEDTTNVNVKIARGGAIVNNVEAQAKLGSWLQKGKWCERDPQQAGQILQPLAWRGVPCAMYWYYELLAHLTPEWPGDPEQALVWFDRAVEAKYGLALKELQSLGHPRERERVSVRRRRGR